MLSSGVINGKVIENSNIYDNNNNNVYFDYSDDEEDKEEEDEDEEDEKINIFSNKIELPKYKALFQQEHIDYETLKLLSDIDLKEELGLPLGDRIRIKKGLQEEEAAAEISPKSNTTLLNNNNLSAKNNNVASSPNVVICCNIELVQTINRFCSLVIENCEDKKKKKKKISSPVGTTSNNNIHNQQELHRVAAALHTQTNQLLVGKR